MATRISRANGSPTLTTKCTFSAWVKRSDNAIGNSGRDCAIMETYTGSNDFGFIRFDGSDQIQIYARNSSGNLIVCDTNAKFRDPYAWYHIVATFDSTESTSSDRVKLYVNGGRQTFQGSTTYPSSSAEVWFNRNSSTFNMGNSERYTSNFEFDGQYSHVHFIDGLAYQASTFGSTDATTGEWKINTAPSVTYGNNGFFLFKDDASLNDDSGNGNNFTLNSGSVQKTEDNPSNVFNTLNILTKDSSDTVTQGNLKWTASSGAGYSTILSTLGFKTGKYYAEAKIISASTYYPVIGIASSESSAYYYQPASRNYIGEISESAGLFMQGDIRINGSAGSPSPASYATNDIVGLAVDLDSATNTLKVYKNGTLDQTYTISAPQGFYHFGCSGGGTTSDSVAWNFGNGFFDKTAVSSNSGNGYSATGSLGIFQYQPPTGYTALCTKGLNE